MPYNLNYCICNQWFLQHGFAVGYEQKSISRMLYLTCVWAQIQENLFILFYHRQTAHHLCFFNPYNNYVWTRCVVNSSINYIKLVVHHFYPKWLVMFLSIFQLSVFHAVNWHNSIVLSWNVNVCLLDVSVFIRQSYTEEVNACKSIMQLVSMSSLMPIWHLVKKKKKLSVVFLFFWEGKILSNSLLR